MSLSEAETALDAVYRIGNYIDTYALGHYARVMDAEHRETGQSVAFKVMRPEHLTGDGTPRWEARAFIHEADLLLRLDATGIPNRLYDCGFVSTEKERPAEGEIVSFGTDIAAYREALYPYIAQRWRPFLALENLPRHQNLFYLMKPTSASARRRLPTEEGLDLAMQFARFLQTAHAERIVYLDHKLEHVYWDGADLRVIDLNSSKLMENGTHTVEQQFNQDIHNLCVGILYPIFTGQSPQKGALRPQPASQNEVERRYANIDELDFSAEPGLSLALRDLLQQGARQELPTADALLAGLERVAVRHGWDLSGAHTAEALRHAREQMRAGLAAVRQGQEALRQAREGLLEAVILDDITEDMENELRRLLGQINDALNHRVIP